MDYIGENGIQDLRQRVFKRIGQAVLDNQGRATLVFDPPITMARDPFIQITPAIDAGGNVVICNRVKQSFTKNAAGAYTGVTIEGARVQNLPTGLTSLNLVVQLNGRKVTEVGSLGGTLVDWLAT